MGKKKGVSKNSEPAAPAYDIWDTVDEKSGKAKAINTPQPVNVAPGWDVNPDMIHRPKGEARKRKIQVVKPNKIAAVELPHAGQSFNPQVDDHQQALSKAVHKLEKQKASHEKFAQWLNIGKTKEEKSLYGGGVNPDYLGSKRRAEGEDGDAMPGAAGDDSEDDEEDEEEGAPMSKNQSKKRRSDVPKKRHIKMIHRKDVKRSRDERRHPDRDQIAADMEDLSELMAEVQERKQKNFERLARRKMRNAEGLQTKKIGRHIHQPLPMEVSTTGNLVTSLRHLKAGEIHPLQHRVKSLEARNLIPARMRHTYNKNKKPKAKGEVMIRKENFGLMPDSTERQ